ncbi:IclR family transcriptional regulator [Limnochorda pilosa]|uniref:Glycerol operon regulatory protein n=1 Tax=Limnochorda pilosa TaxID=1555112 RepID=A0A0K2SMH9_LIMPI|nr:IclR family transcriptional regulator [Limnochorda pilosa]BAS28202.1 IclR family transcriptional regulator [Limnochorda pilosa]
MSPVRGRRGRLTNDLDPSTPPAGIKAVRSVERVLDLLECFSFEQPEWTLSDLARQTQLPTATAQRLLRTLQRRGWIQHSPHTGRYSLGLRFLELGGLVLASFRLREKAQPHLDHLSEATGHTVLLGTLSERKLVYVDRRDSTAPLRVASELGRIRPPTYGILGKLLLAHLEEREAESLLAEAPLQARATKSIVDPGCFMEELRRVRAQGYACAVDETVDGVAGVAAPIRDHTGTVVAGLALLVPTPGWTDELRQRHVEAVVSTASRISEAMGYRADAPGSRSTASTFR